MKKITSLLMTALLCWGLATPMHAGDNVEVGSVYFIRTAGTSVAGHYLGVNRKEGSDPAKHIGFTNIVNGNGNQTPNAYTFVVEAGSKEGQYKIKCLDNNKYLKYTTTTESSDGVQFATTANETSLDWKIVENTGECKAGETNVVDIIPGELSEEGNSISWNPHGGFNSQPNLGLYGRTNDASAWVFEKVMKLSTLTNNSFDNSKMHWYALEIQRAGDLKYASYDSEKNNNPDIPKNRIQEANWADNYLYAFVANTNGGINIYSKAAGADKVLMDSRTTDGDIKMNTLGKDAWTIMKCKKDGDNGFVLKKRGSNNGYLHDFGGKLGFWFSEGAVTDVGSFIKPVSFVEAEKNMAKREMRNLKSSYGVRVPAVYGAFDLAAACAKIDELTGDEATIRKAATPIINNSFWKLIDGKSFIMKNNGNNDRNLLYLTPNDNQEDRGIYGQPKLMDKLIFTFRYADGNTFYVYNNATDTYFGKTIGKLVADADKAAYNFDLSGNGAYSAANMVALTLNPGEHRVHQSTFNGNIIDHANLGDGATIWTLFSSEQMIPDFIAECNLIKGCVGGYSVEQTVAINEITTLNDLQKWLDTPRIQLDVNKLYRIKNYKRILANLGQGSTTGNKDEIGNGGYLGTTPYPGYEGKTRTISCGTNVLDDAGTIWKFETVANSNGYHLINLNKNAYLGGQGNTEEGGYVSLQTTNPETNAGTYLLDKKATGTFRIGTDLENNKVLHPSNNGVIFWDNGSDEACFWHIEEANVLDVAMKSPGESYSTYSTLYVPFAVSMPEGVKAYTGSKEGNTLTMHEVVGEIPANTGIVLKDMNKKDKVSLNILASTQATVQNNAIIGSNTSVVLQEGDHANYFVFGLRKSDGALGFYHPSSAITSLKANKAFIHTPAAAVNGYVLNFDGEATGIEGVLVETDAKSPIYDLSGRRVLNTVKGGIYIQNGKKFIVK